MGDKEQDAQGAAAADPERVIVPEPGDPDQRSDGQHADDRDRHADPGQHPESEGAAAEVEEGGLSPESADIPDGQTVTGEGDATVSDADTSVPDADAATLEPDRILQREDAESEPAPVEPEEPLVGSAELKAIVEALIFASPEPLSLSAITKLLDGETRDDVAAALTALKADYERPGGLQLVEVAGGFQIVTRPDLNDWVRRLFHERSTQKLSVQALETLAVIAYRQPITAAEVTEIRGVNTAGVLNTLLERHLVKIVGRKAVVGRPFMYSTTKEFLIRFGLNDIDDLPRVQDMVDALGLESPLLVERMTAEEQLPLEEPDVEGANAAPSPAPGAQDE